MSHTPLRPSLRHLWLGLLLGSAALSAVQALPAGMARPVPAELPALDFRDASLQTVFESLSASSGINFVFDKDMPRATRVSLRLRGSTLDEALNVLMRTHQLDYKALGERTLLMYPSSPAKHREHQDLELRTFYLKHIDAKTAFALLRTLLKTRDLMVDERLNLLLLRDTPAVAAMAERLLDQMDQAEAELVLNVELLEIGRSQSAELGLNWPQQLSHGMPGGAPQSRLSEMGHAFTGALNPLLLAQLRGARSTKHLLARPQLRARNHEKVRLKIGERLPVFNSTAANGAMLSTSVAYLDVGLNLEVEADIRPDGDIRLKLDLEIQNILAREQSAGVVPASAYRTGTSSISSILNLSNGQTQLIAGMFSTEDRHALAGVPGLSALPLLGRLFGTQADQHTQTELVLLLTPHVLSQPSPLEGAARMQSSGLDGQAGAPSARLRPSAAVSLWLNGAPAVDAEEEPEESPPDSELAGDRRALLQWSSAGAVTAGEDLSITLQNTSAAVMRGQLGYDTALFQVAAPVKGSQDHAGQLSFELPPRAQRVLVLRALAQASGVTELSLSQLVAQTRDGSVEVRVEGQGRVEIAEP